jgi:hypothetical protein
MAKEQIKRKCPSCSTWNTKGEHRCKTCGVALQAELIIEEEYHAREKKRLERPRTKLDELVESLKGSRNPLVRILYFIVYSIWLVYIGILGFILWLIAWTPG